MEKLERDPVIQFYLKMSEPTEHEHEGAMPIYNEMMLRLSIRQVLGNLRAFDTQDIKLYRLLLLFHFSVKFKAIEDLMKIMPCFSETEIYEYFDNSQTTMLEWQKFTLYHLKDILYKEAFYAIMFEWTRRSLHLFGAVNNTKLRSKVAETQNFLNWRNSKCTKQYENRLSSVNIASKDKKDLENIYGTHQLEIPSIYDDIKWKLNPLVTEQVQSIRNFEKIMSAGPPKKRFKLELIETSVNMEMSLPKKFVMQLEDEEELETNTENNEVIEATDEDSEPNVGTVQDFDFERHAHHDERDIVGNLSLNSETSKHDLSDEDDIGGNEVVKVQDKKSNIIGYDTAMRYLSALQAFAVVNGHCDAILLLDKVDSTFRKNYEMK